MQHDPAHRDTLAFDSPTGGEPVNASFPVSRTPADRAARRAASSTWARYSHGFPGRTADYSNSTLAALSTA